MRVVIQRVRRASVTVGGQLVSEIGGTESSVIAPGMLAFAGFRNTDTLREVEWMARKLPELRIFEDGQGKMNRSLRETGGSILVVSQFTLYGDSRKGNRPNFLVAARPEQALTLFDDFLRLLHAELGTERVLSGVFRANMQVELVNDGPVTLILEREAERDKSF